MKYSENPYRDTNICRIQQMCGQLGLSTQDFKPIKDTLALFQASLQGMRVGVYASIFWPFQPNEYN